MFLRVVVLGVSTSPIRHEVPSPCVVANRASQMIELLLRRGVCSLEMVTYDCRICEYCALLLPPSRSPRPAGTADVSLCNYSTSIFIFSDGG